jgi:hypothetical protein
MPEVNLESLGITKIPSLTTFVLIGGLVWQGVTFVSESRNADMLINAQVERLQRQLDAMRTTTEDKMQKSIEASSQDRQAFGARIARLEERINYQTRLRTYGPEQLPQ